MYLKEEDRMKKVILGLVLTFVIIGCGKDYETYTFDQKRKMYMEAYVEYQDSGQTKDEKVNKFYALRDKLEVEAEKGDRTAEKEYREWVIVIQNTFYFPTPTEKANLNSLNW